MGQSMAMRAGKAGEGRYRHAAFRIITRGNEGVALRMTIMFGSIWCVYAFTVFSLIPLLMPKSQDTLLYVSNCIQLIALPALMVGSALLAKNTEQRAAQDHEALVEVLADVREELATVKAIAASVAANVPAAPGAPAAAVATAAAVAASVG